MLFDILAQAYEKWFKENRIDNETYEIIKGMFNEHYSNLKIKSFSNNETTLINPLDTNFDYTMQPYNLDDTTGLLLFEHSQKDRESDIVFCATKNENTEVMVQSIQKTDLGMYFESYSNKKYVLNYYNKDTVEYLQSTNGDADSIKPDMKLIIQINPGEYVTSVYKQNEQYIYKQFNPDFNISTYQNLQKCRNAVNYDELIKNMNQKYTR